MSRMRRVVGFSSAALLLFAALTGCTHLACSEIGYLYAVEVQTTGEFAVLEACVGGDCVTSADADIPTSLMFTVANEGADVWSVGPFPSTPDRLTLRARDDAGVAIAEERYDLEWTRTGGSEQCGGPMETPAVEFAA